MSNPPPHLFPRTPPSRAPPLSILHSPKVLIPLILGGVLLTALFILAFRHWLWQDDHNTIQDIEAAVRPRHRSTSITSRISAIDVEACRGALGRAARSTGRVMSSGSRILRSSVEGVRSPSPIMEETAEEMRDGDLETGGGDSGTGGDDDSVEERGEGEDLVKVTTWGSVIAPMSWIRKAYSQGRREEAET